MSVLISNDGGIQVPIDADEIVQVIQAVLSAEEVERECSVSVSIVDEDEIQSLNAMWRQIDAPTDVLSFECDSPFGDEVPDGEVVELGDVILCPAVIAAQAPKLSPYREAMRENLAAAMGIAVENVGVKATTTEHLGFEGREEGISATAVCLLCRSPDEQRD